MNRLLLDQGLPRSTADLLRAAGWDAVHVSECGLSTATAAEILERARSDNRVVCTLDADFHGPLAVSGVSRPSRVRIRQEGLRAQAVASLLERVWQDAKDAIDAGAAVTVTERAIRVRRLPMLRANAVVPPNQSS